MLSPASFTPTAADAPRNLHESAPRADHRSQPMPPRRGRRGALTVAQECAIVEQYAAGESTRELVRAFAVSQAAVCDVLYGAGQALRPGTAKRRLTLEQEQQLGQRYATGCTQRQLASEYRVSCGTVRNVLRRQATRTRLPGDGRLLTLEQEHDVVARYRAGAELEAIRESFGISTGTVRAVLRRTGVPLRVPAPAVPDQAVPAIVAEYRAGATLRTLGRRYGVSRATIHTVLKRQGVARRPACPRPAAPPRQAAVIAADYRAGDSIRALADRHGVGYDAIAAALESQGVAAVPLAGRGPRPHSRLLPIGADHRAGEPIGSLADRYGLSHGAVVKALRRSSVAGSAALEQHAG